MELTKEEDKLLRRALYSDLKERRKFNNALGILLSVFCLAYLLDLYYGLLGGVAVRVYGLFSLFGFLAISLIVYIPIWYSQRTNALSLIRKLHSDISPSKQLHANLNPDYGREQR